MHITMLALGSRGDIQPYVVLGKGLRRAGHKVRFITFESFVAFVEQADLKFYPIRGDARALVMAAGANMLALIRSFGSLAEGYAQDL
ncbi:MAG: glycosyltransferase, partial [Anaerolineales bacterium]|nr:glycosyltransferase [Anaerolineales bacterium]